MNNTTTYIKLRKSIDSLLEQEYNQNEFNFNSLFYIEKSHIRSWMDYGWHHIHQYDLRKDYQSKPIKIDGVTFDNKIEHYYYAPIDSHSLKIISKNKNGKIYQMEYCWKGLKIPIAPMIIYTIILISVYGAEKIRSLYETIFHGDKVYKLTLGKSITLLEEIKDMFCYIEEDYNFMEWFYQQAVKDLIINAKNELEDYEVLLKS